MLTGFLLSNIVICSACGEELIGKILVERLLKRSCWNTATSVFPDNGAHFLLVPCTIEQSILLSIIISLVQLWDPTSSEALVTYPSKRVIRVSIGLISGRLESDWRDSWLNPKDVFPVVFQEGGAKTWYVLAKLFSKLELLVSLLP